MIAPCGVNEAELHERLLRRARERGHHRVEHRQRNRRADSAQHARLR
jgi:hypothetical protein